MRGVARVSGRKHPSAAKPSAWCFVHAGNKPGQGAAAISRQVEPRCSRIPSGEGERGEMEGNRTEIPVAKEAWVVGTSSYLSAVRGWRRWHAPGGTGTSLGQGTGCIPLPSRCRPARACREGETGGTPTALPGVEKDRKDGHRTKLASFRRLLLGRRNSPALPVLLQQWNKARGTVLLGCFNISHGGSSSRCHPAPRWPRAPPARSGAPQSPARSRAKGGSRETRGKSSSGTLQGSRL